MTRSRDGLYRSNLLEAIPWVVHGFGTRHARWPESYRGAHQIHSDVVLVVDGAPGELGSADGLILQEPGVIGVRTADCVPVLLADQRRPMVAALHAGWRGTAAGISAKAVLKMRELGASDLVAAIGPAIGPCCYEVGPEVAEQFKELLPESIEARYIDLIEANRRQLVAAGLDAELIDAARLCTRCHAEEFHSWRREGKAAGRMISAIGIRQ